ncbi:unnamed protein product [Adineta steineri]|uniref:Uncharacterized protein n=1 Tax=Adineta steineri TaxID=433720 RepID=A0A818XA23_9BILA|nr:unnamed protein product [Adineta steineri]
MNLNDEEDEDTFFTQHCLELAKLLRTEQTEHFLHLYDSLPSEWNGSRLESAKEYIRQLQELDENEFEHIYQHRFSNDEKSNHSNTVMSKQSTIIRNDDNDNKTTNNRITSLALLQQKQHIERTTANNLACDEQHNISSKHSLSLKKNNDELNTKTRRLQPITNNNTHDMISNNCRTRTPVDSFVQLNLKPAIDITVEDYKKTRVSLPTTKHSSINSRSSLSQSNDINDSNQQNTTTQSNMIKNHKKSMENKSHEEATFGYFFKDGDDDDDNRKDSRSSSSSPIIPFSNSSTKKNDSTIKQTLSHEHSKLITNNDFDSHGSSIATKSSSENSGSTRTGSGSDSDDEHHHHHHQSHKGNSSSNTKSSLPSKTKFFNNDDTPTVVLNTISDNRPNQHDRISSLPTQDSYELVQSNSNDDHRLVASQVPRFKLSSNDDPNGNNNSNNDILSYTTQRSQQNNLSSSSQQNRNSERHEQYNTNHSNSERKSTTRPSKKRKQLQQQEIIRTELIPGHRGDRDVDELVMFIDGNSSSKQQQQRHNTTAPLRLTDTNSNNNNTTTTTSTRRKSRKPIKILQESSINNNNENKTSPIDEDTQSIGFIDEDDETTSTATVTSTTTHSLDNKYNEQNTTNTSLSNDDESHSTTNDINSTNNSNTTNGEITLPEWFEPIRSTSPVNDDNDSFSLSSTTLNNSNSEIISEPFVTVTHRRRLTKERRQDSNPSSSSRTSHFPLSSSSHNNNNNNNDKRRFQQNENVRSTIRNGPLNTQPYVNTATKEEKIDSASQTVSQTSVLQSPPPSSQPPAPPVPLTSSISNNSTEQRSPRLSSQSSSSSLSSLLKRQSKPPPVVFLNKSVDVELNDVSFGFDVDNPIIDDKPLTPTLSSPPPPPSTEKEPEILSSTQSNDFLINSKSSSSRRSYQSQQQQRGNRGSFFYSGPDIRTHNHRNYPSQTPVTQPSYIDPVLLQQYNQQRLANYSQQLAYMNLFRTQYMHSQQPYILIPATYTATNDNDQDEKILDDETISTSEHIQEPLLVYTPIPTQLGPIYLQQTKKLSNDLEQQMPIPTIYPQQYYYPPQTSHPAYFQPISSPTLILDTKSQQDGSDDEQEEQDNNYEKSTRLFHQTRQQSSSHIMSNALQLVYSQERRNAQTDHFNLDQLTAYLAMKWTDTIDHYEQGNIFETTYLKTY